MVTLTDLPDSVLLEIFSYLPVRDRIRISRCGPSPRGKEPGRGRTRRCGSGPSGAGVVLTAGPLPQGLSPLEEAGGRPVAVATCRLDALHGTRGRWRGPGLRLDWLDPRTSLPTLGRCVRNCKNWPLVSAGLGFPVRQCGPVSGPQCPRPRSLRDRRAC